MTRNSKLNIYLLEADKETKEKFSAEVKNRYDYNYYFRI